MIRPDLSLPIPETIEAAHFIGIGGSGMSGLARMFLERGIRVSGSDRADSPRCASSPPSAPGCTSATTRRTSAMPTR